MALLTRLLALRSSPILLQLPPYLSALCVTIGVAWLAILPLNGYSRQTYVSENAILPGQVHTYFGGSEHNVFRAYRQEMWTLSQQSDEERLLGIGSILKDNGLKVATQSYAFNVAGEEIAGTNAYGLLQGPRADGTEAMVLIAAWKNFDGEINYSGVALALTLARYFKRWSIWSKDIIILIPADSVYGPEAWVAAYHTTSIPPTASRNISALPLKSGALQAAVALDYPVGPWGHRFDKLDILYDGINGALPNLDLLNTAVSVASGQMGIGCCLHGLKDHSDSYRDRLDTLLKGIVTQGAGRATGPHSAFMPYHVDAITLKTVGDGWHDEMSLGRTTESLFRSINNLLEHLHQSFFFYILLNANRFVSIGNYLPAAMLIAGNFSVMALALWVQSERALTRPKDKPSAAGKADVKSEGQIVKDGPTAMLVPAQDAETVEREMFLPAVTVLAVHLASFIPLYALNNSSHDRLPVILQAMTITSLIAPVAIGAVLARAFDASPQQLQITQSFSLLLLGAALSTLATLNFSLAFVIGVLASPLSFVRPLPTVSTMAAGITGVVKYKYVLALTGKIFAAMVAFVLSPPLVIAGVYRYYGLDVGSVLLQMAQGWVAQGAWTSFVIWCLWWPAWVIGNVVTASSILRPAKK